MYQLIYDFLYTDLIGTITAPVILGHDPVLYSALLSHVLTNVVIILMFILAIKFVIWVFTLFGVAK